MNKTSLIIITLVLAGFASTSQAADDGFFSWFSLERKNEVAHLVNETYKEECGSCHFPYQPGLLPEASWLKLMKPAALEDHFGDNAELDKETSDLILKFLVANSADKSNYKRSKKIMASLKKDKAPLRIIETPYIRRKHHEIPDKLIKDNPKVESLSYCDNCHKKADQGNYDDDSVVIPGYGNWTW